MPRLIDADALRQDWLENGQNEYVYDTNAILDSIDNAPTIDPESLRPHGRWVFQRGCYEADECICSLCGRLLTTHAKERANYCPNCGAKMDGEEDDEPKSKG